MDAIRTRITFGRVTKSRAAEKRRRIFKSSEWSTFRNYSEYYRDPER